MPNKLAKCVHINSKLYSDLFEQGGDALIAVYAKLKYAKRWRVKIYKESNSNIYHTLKRKTGLSTSTLRKYIKTLIKLNLCHFDTAGNFCMLGTNKIQKRCNKKKTVPVEIGDFKQTQLFSFRIRLKKMEQMQKNRIDRRHEQSKITARLDKGYKLSDREKKIYNSFSDKDYEYIQCGESFTAKTVLSNQGYSKLKFGQTKSAGSGRYWKNKLQRAGIVKTRRNLQYLRKCSYEDYRSMKNEGYRSLVLLAGKLYKELPMQFTTTDWYKPEVTVEKLDHLDFDFCYFLANQ